MLEGTVNQAIASIGVFVVIIYCIILERKEHPIIGWFSGMFIGSLVAIPWFLCWPLGGLIYIWALLSGEGNTGDIFGIREEPVYNIFGDEIGTAKIFGNTIISTDIKFTSPNDIQRDAFGNLKRKF